MGEKAQQRIAVLHEVAQGAVAAGDAATLLREPGRVSIVPGDGDGDTRNAPARQGPLPARRV